jgi:diaminopimelate epimerase
VAIRFHKLHGAGNDFVLLDLRQQDMALGSTRAAAIAERKTGIGCDQLLVLRPASVAGALCAFEVWNADGSQAEQCGNGIRCIALYLQRRGEVDEQAFQLQGPAGMFSLQCLADGQVQAGMGKAQFEPGDIPTLLAADNGQYTLELGGQPLQLGLVSMGNPHAVLLVDDVSSAPVNTTGAEISVHPAFPEGCNVGFAQVIDRHTMHLRVRERGAGETRACGSGACAAASHAQRLGLVDSPVRVIQAGGLLIIEIDPVGWSVQMTGPAVYVFEGTLE